jgi:hypothetical protein
MMANIDIQIVWNENKGEVQLFIGDFRIGLPPALCEALEKELAAARRIPEQARLMVGGAIGGAMSDADAIPNHGPGNPLSHSPLDCPAHVAGGGLERKAPAAAREPEITG